jgi:hypothetical protein
MAPPGPHVDCHVIPATELRPENSSESSSSKNSAALADGREISTVSTNPPGETPPARICAYYRNPNDSE